MNFITIPSLDQLYGGGGGGGGGARSSFPTIQPILDGIGALFSGAGAGAQATGQGIGAALGVSAVATGGTALTMNIIPVALVAGGLLIAKKQRWL